MMMIRYTIKNDWPTGLNNEILPVLCKNFYYIILYYILYLTLSRQYQIDLGNYSKVSKSMNIAVWSIVDSRSIRNLIVFKQLN